MSVMYTKKIKAFNGAPLSVERFDTCYEVVDVCNMRPVNTAAGFYDVRQNCRKDFQGVDTFGEAQNYLANGYEATVRKLKDADVNLAKQGKRFKFENNVQGFAPVVPLALMGVPNSMISMRMKPIKVKVLNVFYDMTCGAKITPQQILATGMDLLAACMELEMQGYKFNLYCTQSYWTSRKDTPTWGADVLCVKVKSSNTPLNLKKMAFPLTHPAFFRAVGFDWYSRKPGAKYRERYGHAIGYDFDDKKMAEGFTELFGEPAVVFTAATAIGRSKESFKKVLSGGK